MLRHSESSTLASQQWASLAHLLQARVHRHPNRSALTFLEEDGCETTLTYEALEARVLELAGRLSSCENSKPGDRALLLFPAGLEFMVAFLACQYARLIPVPTCYPKPGRAMPRLDSAASDCQPTLLLTDRETLPGIDLGRLSDAVGKLQQIATDENVDRSVVSGFEPDLDQIKSSDLGLLQYTSGSTSQPKGVMVSHGNLMANLEAIRQGFGLTWSDDASGDFSRGVFWLPPFHDMGLIGGILEALYIGGHTVLMSPRSFLSRPLRWLETISNTNASISGAPNFAYQLCVDRIDAGETEGIDLGCLEVAFCGAEPIFPETLEDFAKHFAGSGFRSESFIPCYGLAEATLLAASSHSNEDLPAVVVDRDALATGVVTVCDKTEPADSSQTQTTRKLVSCGKPALNTRIEVVDPSTCESLGEDKVGEIWLQGDSITQGYWDRAETNKEQFQATIQGNPDAGQFLRTGDLGFLHDGDVYVTGRCKDVIILRGRNHFPQDIEATIARVLGDDGIKSVAIAQEGAHGDTLTTIVEVSRHLPAEDLSDVVRRIRRAVIEDHEVDARRVVLTRPAAIPLTTSGKVQRAACRGLLDDGHLSIRHEWNRSSLTKAADGMEMPPLPQRVQPDGLDQAAEQIETWLLAWLVARGDVAQSEVHADTPFADYGLDSLAAVELSGELEDWLGIELTPVLAWNYPTPSRLAVYLAEELATMSGLNSDGSDSSKSSELGSESAGLDNSDEFSDPDGDFERLLAEIEQLPEE